MPVNNSLRDFLFTYKKRKMSEIREDPGCLTLSQDMMDERDFIAWDTIELDTSIKLPDSFSLWEWIRKTNYQNGRGSCTSNGTAHWVQILCVKKGWKKPETENIITPDRKDLRSKMWHDLNNKDDSWDYVEKAVNTALKNWIKAVEWWECKFDWFCYGQRACNDESIETMKRYLYRGCPIVRCLRWNKTTRSELTKWELKTILPVTQRTGGHCIALVGWDKGGLRFVNSWTANDWKGMKSRFYVSNETLKKSWGTFNRRYRVLFNKEDAKKDPAYLKRKNNAAVIIKALKKIYPEESENVRKWIEAFSKAVRTEYPELNEEIPLNS